MNWECDYKTEQQKWSFPLKCVFSSVFSWLPFHSYSAKLLTFKFCLPCQSWEHTCSIRQWMSRIHQQNNLFFPFFFFDAIPSELSSHMVLSWQRWRCGYGRLHTNLMLRPLQMTRDTSSDDIFFQLFPSWMASAAPCKHPSTTPNNKPPIRALTPWFLVTMAPQPPAVTWLTPLSRCWIWSNHSQSSLNISFFKQRAQNFVIQSPDQSPITQSSQSRLIRREPFQERQLGDETRDLQKGVNLLWSEALFVSRL